MKRPARLAALAAILDVRPGERLPISLLLIHSFTLGGAIVFAEVSATALFLTTFGAADLAYVYLAAPAIIALVGAGYARLAPRLAAGRLLTAIVAMLFGSACLFAVGLRLPDASWLIFALLVWYWMLEYLGSLAFWVLAGRLFDLQQGKRLFGLVGSGRLLAQVLGFWLTPLLVPLVGTANLILFSTAGLGLTLLVLLVTVRRFPALAAAPARERRGQQAEPGRTAGLAALMKDRYILAICLATVLSTGAYFFVEYGFATLSRARFQDADQLARFLGFVFGAMNAARLLTRLFLARWVLGRFGLGVGLLALPVVTAVGMASVAVAGTLALPLGLVFGLMIATRLGEGVVRDALHRTSEVLLYQPLRADRRVAAQTTVESVVDPLAMGLSGAALLLLGAASGFTVARLALISLPFIALWIAVSLAVYRGYIAALGRALSRQLLGGATLALDDAATLAVIEAKLAGGRPAEVLYALDLLAQAGPARLAPHLPGLLAHADPLVRQDVVARIERLGLVEALPALCDRLAAEDEPPVLAAIVQALGTLTDDDETLASTVVRYLRHPDARVRVAALAGLLRVRRTRGAFAADELFTRLCASADPQDRALAAEALGRLGAEHAVGPLEQLLRDDDPRVRRAALAAAGQVRAAALWPAVVEGLRAPATRRAARSVLAAGGEAALPALTAAAEGADAALLGDLAQVAGRVGGGEAVALLRPLAGHRDPGVRSQALRSLSRCGYRATAKEIAWVRGLVRAEVGGAAGILAAQVDIGGAAEDGAGQGASAALALLGAALTGELDGHRDRIGYLLSYLHDEPALHRLRAMLTAPSADQRAYALELLSLLVAPDLRALVLPLFAELAPSERLRRLRTLFPQRGLGRPGRLTALIGAPDGVVPPWTRACALHAAGHLGDATLCSAAVAALAAPAPLVRATALWAVWRLDGVEYDRQITRLHHDPDPQVARAVCQVGLARRGGARVLSTIERVIILKSVGVFGQLDDPVLAEVAGLLEEEEVAAGQVVFSEGDLGTSMYIVVDGEVRVHSGAHTLNHLKEREVFGEMALLDPEPRLASVTAVVDTRLLRLDQAPFYELLEDRIEVARGIIQMLSQRLRARVADLNELRARLATLEQQAALEAP